LSANPQLKNGYTRISNGLLEAILKYKAPALHHKIIFTIIRFTYGYGRKETNLSVRAIARFVDAKSTSKISTALSDLINCKVVLVTAGSIGSRSRVLMLNKDYTSWKEFSRSSNTDVDNFKKVNATDHPVVNTNRSPRSEHIKENIKKTYKYNLDVDNSDQNEKDFIEHLSPGEISETLSLINSRRITK